MAEVNWNALLASPNPGMAFQAGVEQGRQRRFENEQMRFQQQQMEQQQADREASIRAGKHVAAGDMAGARAQAAASGNLDLVGAISRMSAEQRAQAAEQAQTLAPVYHRLRQIPDVAQRRAELQRLAPQLAQRGIPMDVIVGYDPTDQNLDSDMALGMTLEQSMQQGAIDWQIIPQVGAFAVDAQGFPVDPRTGQRTTGPAMGQQPQVAQPGQPQPQAQPTAASGYAQGVATALASAGVPAPVVAGIVANGEHESGGRWNEAVGDNGTAFGGFQWRNDRVSNFQQVTGVHPSQATPEQTAQFVLWELQNPEAAGMTREQVQAIMTAQDPRQAALLFSQHYERPNAALAHNDRRAALASQFAGQQTAQASPVQMPGQQMSIQDQAATGVIQAPRQAPPGYQWTPQGQLQAIPGGPGDQTYQRGQDAQRDEREGRSEMRQTLQNFNSDPEVRQFRAARIATMQINNLGQSGSPSDDVALIFSFMRALDPNSTVREGEFATAQNTAGIPDRIRNMYNQAMQGTLLNPGQRRQFTATAQRLYLDRARSYNEVANNYRAQLLAMGIPSAEVARLVQTAEGPQREDRRRAQERATVRGSSGAAASSGQPRRQGRQVTPTIRVRQ